MVSFCCAPARTIGMALWGRALLVCCVLCTINTYQARAHIVDLPTLSVMVDSSISLPITVIARHYARQNGIAVNVTSDDSSALVKQITEGVAADVFITAHARWVEDLKLQGMIDVYSPANIAANRLGLLTFAGNTQEPPAESGAFGDWLLELAQQGVLMISNPDTREDGYYTRILLRKLGVWDSISPFLLYTENPYEIPAAVASQRIYAITYKTATQGRSDVKLLPDFPMAAAPVITYQAVVVAGEQMDAARQFLMYLSEDASRNLLASYGFQALRGAAPQPAAKEAANETE